MKQLIWIKKQRFSREKPGYLDYYQARKYIKEIFYLAFEI